MIASIYLNHETFPEDRKAKMEGREYDWEKNGKENRHTRAFFYEEA